MKFLSPLFALGFVLTGYFASAQPTGKKSAFNTQLPDIVKSFEHIPDAVQTSVYWYWMSGNISKEGVVADLEAMKKAGINRAFIGQIEWPGTPPGKVKLFTEEWWDILHLALKTATKLHIEIGMFNAPGWSQSGGPWIKPEQAMRYLTSSELFVSGPGTLEKKLVLPIEQSNDVKVIAYPVPADFKKDITSSKPVMTSVPKIDSLNNLFDDDLATWVSLIPSKRYLIEFNVVKPYAVSSATFILVKEGAKLESDIQAEINGQYKTFKHFIVDRSNPVLNVGFSPFGPGAVAVPLTTAKRFRISLNSTTKAMLAEVKLSATPVVENYLEKSLGKMWQTPYLSWNSYTWETQPVQPSKQIINPDEVIDISKHMRADGTLLWNVPDGNWVIERIVATPTRTKNTPAPAEATGLEVDKMSKANIELHFHAYIGEILKRIPSEDRRTFKVVVQDSYETGGQNWTENFISEFIQEYKYSPIPYFPTLSGKVVGNEEMSNRFLWDMRRLIANDVSFKYVGGMREICHRYGLTTWLENYGHFGFPGDFLQYGGQSDEVGGEFWNEGSLGDIENRAASSAAHIYGKNKVSGESWTSAGNAFGRYPAALKMRGDRFFTEGINNTVLHVYIHQPDRNSFPGLNAEFGTEFNRKNTWFDQMDVFTDYIKRCNMMLQQGTYVADAAYFIGEDAPRMTGITDPPLPKGYSYDYINGDVIKERLTVKNGKLVLRGGVSYRVLVLPKQKTMRPELLARLKELIGMGAVVLGPKPEQSPSLADYPNADHVVRTMADELWGNADGKKIKVHPCGKGAVLVGMRMEEVMKFLAIAPDFEAQGTDSILFIHRKLDGGSLYFISNQNHKPVNFKALFRVTGKVPQLCDPVTGKIRELHAYQQNDHHTTIPMQLEAGESAFILFDRNSRGNGSKKTNYPVPAEIIDIKLPWLVAFDKKMRGPDQVKFKTLDDWSKNDNDSIRYYSGKALYKNEFSLVKKKSGFNYLLEFARIGVMAKVKINGVDAGAMWTPPYRTDITRALKAGKNKIEVEVVNTWINRLYGDHLLPQADRQLSPVVHPEYKLGLAPSGLIGPARISVVGY
ncbi:MAG: glycoside hydrolase family 2 [Mucilaginibacter sp.]|nr:glycoside hydrolase family 2 [Mucilaginibacter sp.]